MKQNQPQVQPSKKQTHWPSLLVLINAGVGLLFFGGIAGTTFINGLFTLFTSKADLSEVAVMLSYASASLLLGVLLIPSIVLAIKRISGQPITRSNLWNKTLALFHPKRLIWLYPLIILAGNWLNNLQQVGWLLMPALNVLALGLPIAWLLWAGIRRLSSGSLQLKWSTFSIATTFSPLLILLTEIFFMIAGFFFVAILLATVFAGTDLNIDTLLSSLSEAVNSQQIPEQLIIEFIRQPAILAIVLFFVSGFVPLIEEVFKPMAVWLLWRKPITAQDGWVLGLLSGAGFALIENLGNTTVGEGWTFLVLARAGASALHMFNTAIISYTFVLAREKKRFLPAVLALIGAILIHALWNGITIFATLFSLENSTDTSGAWTVGYIIILIAISLSMVGGILMINRRLFAKSSQGLAMQAAREPKTPEGEVSEIFESEQ